MSASAFTLWIDGYPATEIAAHTPPMWETLADGGCGEATFALSLTSRSNHQALRNGALVQVKCAGMPVYTGTMTEPDRTTWECHAYGLSSSLRDYLALDGAGSNTRDVSVAVASAIAAGWKGANLAPVSGTPAGDTEGNPISVGVLLDDLATQLGQRWGVDHMGRLFMRADPTTPQWSSTPGTAVFGVTDESVATRLAGRYDSGAGNLTAIWPPLATEVPPGPQEAVDLTDRGPMTLMAAEVILAGMLIRRGGVAWTNGAVLSTDQLTTRGGTPAFLATVRGGQMVRAMGLTYGAVARTPRDVVIGKTRYTAGAKEIYVEPVNTAPRYTSAVIAAA